MSQLVTFRLHDALPRSRRSEGEALLQIENDRERRWQLEVYLDRGLGESWLRQPTIATLAESALRFFDGQRYRLDAWVVMPNHVPVLVEVWQTPWARLIKSWKVFIAREANKRLGREGTFWEREYWDTQVRAEEHRVKAVRYLENNPVKAGLAPDPKEWLWSSAHVRDNHGRLQAPTTDTVAGRSEA